MENVNALMTAWRIGNMPKFKPSFIGLFAAVGAGGLGWVASQGIGGTLFSNGVTALSCIACMWIAHRYTVYGGDNNGGWHWLTDPPSTTVSFARHGKMCMLTTEVLRQQTGDESLTADETQSEQYRILTVRNSNPAQLDSNKILSAIAIAHGIKNVDAVKFISVFSRGVSAFLLPLPRSGWSPVKFDESIIQNGKPLVQLGKDLNGNTIMIDLQANPHTLVAGMTGSGKTAWIAVYIRSLLASGLNPILYILDPNDNLSSFSEAAISSGGAYITDLVEGANLLRLLVTEPGESESTHQHNFIARKKRMKGAQNIWTFRHAGGSGEDARPIVIVEDEIAAWTTSPDVNMKKQVIADNSTIARRFRAAGALLLASTQRPSTDILPGEFKANCGNIIAFSHANKSSSRVTLDSNDAAGLPGAGGFVARFGGSDTLVYGRATYMDI